MPADPAELARAQRRIDALCDRYEDDLRAGRPASVAAVLADAPPELHPDLFRSLLAVELEFRRKAGRSATRAELRERYAALGPWVEKVLARLLPDDADDRPTELVVTHGPYAGRTFPLVGRGTFTLGRQSGHHVSLPDDEYLSRSHCLLESNPPLLRVIDMGSKAGTRVNGRKAGQADLRNGDEVRVGGTVFRVRLPAGTGDTTLLTGAGSPVGRVPAGPPVIPGYTVLRELGRGAMGVVYYATRHADSQPVAVKTLHPSTTPNRNALARFVREADILRDLSHPHVVGFRGAGAAGPHLYFVMEYVDGVSGSAVVKEHGPLPAERVLHWAAQIFDALGHAHERKYVHRDVKPSNLLVVGPPGAEVVKVSDFGLARTYEESSVSGLTAADTPGGTPAYMPPEQVRDFRGARPAADQYAAAATLYHLLTSAGVYEPVAKPHELLDIILNTDPIPLRPNAPPLPGRFGPVLRRALARKPEDRYPSVRVMAAALFGR